MTLPTMFEIVRVSRLVPKPTAISSPMVKPSIDDRVSVVSPEAAVPTTFADGPIVSVIAVPSIRKYGPAGSSVPLRSVTGVPIVLTLTSSWPLSVTPGISVSEPPRPSEPAMPPLRISSSPLSATLAMPSPSVSCALGTEMRTIRVPSPASVSCSNSKLPVSTCPSTLSVTFVPRTRRYGLPVLPAGAENVNAPIAAPFPRLPAPLLR